MEAAAMTTRHAISHPFRSLQICPNALQPQTKLTPPIKSSYNCRRPISIITSADTSTMSQPIIKVAGIAGSLRKASFHRGLLRCAIEITRECMPHMEIDVLEIGNLPFVNTDLEVGNTFPPEVEEFREKVLRADSILFASPEYNYSVSAPLKNAIDWASRPPNMWADKPAAVMSAGGNFGGGRAQYHLRQIGVFIDLHLINRPELFIQAFQSPGKFDSDGNVVDTDTRERVKAVLASLYKYTIRLKNREVLS